MELPTDQITSVLLIPTPPVLAWLLDTQGGEHPPAAYLDNPTGLWKPNKTREAPLSHALVLKLDNEVNQWGIEWAWRLYYIHVPDNNRRAIERYGWELNANTDEAVALAIHISSHGLGEYVLVRDDTRLMLPDSATHADWMTWDEDHMTPNPPPDPAEILRAQRQAGLSNMLKGLKLPIPHP